MFRKFCRLDLDQGVPQATTVGRFRMALEKSGRLEVVLSEIIRQLVNENGLKYGLDQYGYSGLASKPLPDATVIEAAQSDIRKGAPETGSHAKVNAKGKMQAKWGI